MAKRKKSEPVVEKKKDDLSITIKVDHTKRKMGPEELQAFLRRRGSGPHGVVSRKTERRKERAKARKEGWS